MWPEAKTSWAEQSHTQVFLLVCKQQTFKFNIKQSEKTYGSKKCESNKVSSKKMSVKKNVIPKIQVKNKSEETKDIRSQKCVS